MKAKHTIASSSSPAKRTRASLGAAIVASLALLPGLALADDGKDLIPDPAEVTIDVVMSNGSGCSGGLSPESIVLADDGSALLVDMGIVAAQNGQGIAITETYKNCNLSLRLNAPAGWTYRIASAEFDYGARLPDADRTGKLSVETWVQGVGTDRERQELVLSGPIGKRDHARLEFEESVFVPCDMSRALNFKNVAQVSNGTNYARVRYLSPVVYNLEWKRCE